MSVTDRARGTPYTRPARNSKVSPFLGTAKAPLILLIAMLSETGLQRRRGRASAKTDGIGGGNAGDCGELMRGGESFRENRTRQRSGRGWLDE